jgi:hypothetical protein
MKKQISLLFGLILLTNVCIASDWTERYVPSRAEWLEYVVKRDITRWTDLWRMRVALNVMVVEPRNEVVVVITPANGEGEFTSATCANYIAIVTQSAENTLRKYDWATGATVKVECV